jgi:corrinoid protein of di/trimethylamine methyltransferase
MTAYEAISAQLQRGRAKKVQELVQMALDAGANPQDILNQGLLEGMSVIGEKFKNHEIFVPEVLVAARAMNAGVAVLKPHLMEEGAQSKGVAVIGTVKGDLHDIGKNLVRMMMEGKGLTVYDLGTDVSAEQYLEAAREHHANLICCSALLTTTMGEMKRVVELVNADEQMRAQVKIMIGGAPVTQEYCDEIGADYYTPDAATAAEVACKICSGEL